MQKFTMLVFIFLSLLCFVGYFLNIGKIISIMGDPITTEIVVRVIGIFIAPLGVVAGFF